MNFSSIDRVVHGPLTALMLLDLASINAPPNKYISYFAYRARRPVIVNRSLNLSGSWGSGVSDAMCIAKNNFGEVCMTAEVKLASR